MSPAASHASPASSTAVWEDRLTTAYVTGLDDGSHATRVHWLKSRVRVV